jgi:probable addiction module antidote protein
MAIENCGNVKRIEETIVSKRTRSYQTWELEKLADPKRAVGYLNATLEYSPDLFLRALGKVAQAHQMSQVAKESGVQRESLYRALSEKGNPTFETLASVLAAVGLRLSIVEVEKLEQVEGLEHTSESAEMLPAAMDIPVAGATLRSSEALQAESVGA